MARKSLLSSWRRRAVLHGVAVSSVIVLTTLLAGPGLAYADQDGDFYTNDPEPNPADGYVRYHEFTSRNADEMCRDSGIDLARAHVAGNYYCQHVNAPSKDAPAMTCADACPVSYQLWITKGPSYRPS